MPNHIQSGIEWCQAVALKGHVEKANSMISQAIATNPQWAAAIQDAWQSFLFSL